MNNHSLTIIVPALNEEIRLERTIESIVFVANAKLLIYEIIIFNDGSIDNTALIADKLATKYDKIRVIHNKFPIGLGAVFSNSLRLAKCSFIMLLPGDNAYNSLSFNSIFDQLCVNTTIVCCRVNQKVSRSMFRSKLSFIYNYIMCRCFRLPIDDIHGLPIYPVNSLRLLDLNTKGISFQLEALVKLHRNKCNFINLPIQLNIEESGTSKSFRLRSFFDILSTMIKLYLT